MSQPGVARVVAVVDNVQDVQYPLDYSFKAINRFQGMRMVGIILFYAEGEGTALQCCVVVH